MSSTLTRIHVSIKAQHPVAWPHFAGSTLRGAFGRALRRAACLTAQPQCQGCTLRANCAYGAVFDPAPPAHPIHPSFKDGLPRYLVQAPALGACQLHPGQTQNFTLLLLPGAQAHQAVIEHILPATVEQQLMQPGLFKLAQTQVSHETIAPLQTTISGTALHAPSEITLRWHTPLRLQQQGKPLFKPHQLNSILLVRALLRRHMQWCQLTQQALPDTHTPTQAAADCTLSTSNLHWHDILRHSSTQNQHLPLGGLIGSAQLRGPAHALRTLQPLLQLGEQLHIGKETVMGLGRYQLSPLQPG